MDAFVRSMEAMQGLHHHYTAFDRVCKPCVAHRSLQNDARRIQCTSKTSRDARKRQQQSMQFNAVCVCDTSRRRGAMARASRLASRKCLLIDAETGFSLSVDQL